MEAITSSTIDAIGYDAQTQCLRIRFKNGGCYDYADVPPDAHAALMAAESKGRHLARSIKPTYKVTGITVQPPESEEQRAAD